MSKKKTKSKKNKSRKQTDKKKSTESPDNQNAEMDRRVEMINHYNQEEEVMAMAWDYFGGKIKMEQLTSLVSSLRNNCLPDILSSKMVNATYKIDYAWKYTEMIKLLIEKNIILASVNYCGCHLSNELIFVANDLLHKLKCDFHSCTFIGLIPMCELDEFRQEEPARIKEILRKAYLKKYYYSFVLGISPSFNES